MHYVHLAIAIIAEVTGTLALRASASFTRFYPSLIVVIGYALAFYFLSLTLNKIPVGIAYAIWSGAGIILIALAGLILYEQAMDLPALTGMALIIAGIVIITGFSKVQVH